jgi:hypothetical protein
MKQVQISHPALVALQGRLKDIRTIAAVQTEQTPLIVRLGREANAAIEEIDQWLTDPAKQVTEEGS